MEINEITILFLVLLILSTIVNVILYTRTQNLIHKYETKYTVLLTQVDQLLNWCNSEHKHIGSLINVMKSFSNNAYNMYEHTMKVLKTSGWTALKLNYLAKAIEEVEEGKDTNIVVMKDLDPKVDGPQVLLEELESVGPKTREERINSLRKRTEKIMKNLEGKTEKTTTEKKDATWFSKRVDEIIRSLEGKAETTTVKKKVKWWSKITTYKLSIIYLLIYSSLILIGVKLYNLQK